MSGPEHEPELVTEPVVVTCAECGESFTVDPLDLQDEDDGDYEWVCLACVNGDDA